MPAPKDYFELFTKQESRRLGHQVARLPANGGSLTIPLKVTAFRIGQVKLNANFNVITHLPSLRLDIRRDGVSILGTPRALLVNTALGPDTLVASPPAPPAPPAPPVSPESAEVNVSFVTVDETVTKGKHTYTFILTNSSPEDALVASYTVTAKSFRDNGKATRGNLFVNQALSPNPAFVILPGAVNSKTILLPTFAQEGSRTRLDIDLQLLTGDINRTDLRFDLTRPDADLINGRHTLFNPFFRELVPPPGTPGTVNIEFVTVDKDLPTPTTGGVAEITYTLTLTNRGTVPIEIGYYSLSADVSPPRSKNFVARQDYRLIPDFARTINPFSRETLTDPLRVKVGKQGPVRLDLNINVVIPRTNSQIFYAIKRDGVTITEGLQVLVKSPPGAITPDTLYLAKVMIDVAFVDSDVCEGKHDYTVDLINYGPQPIEVDFFSFNSEA